MLTKFVEYCNSFITILRSALLSRDCTTLRILKFLSPMHFIHITLLPIHSNSRSLKNGRRYLVSFDFDAPQPDSKRQKLLECVLTGNSKLYLGKVYTEERVNELSDEEVDKPFSNYEAKLSGQMVKSLGKSIINVYSMGACAV